MTVPSSSPSPSSSGSAGTAGTAGTNETAEPASVFGQRAFTTFLAARLLAVLAGQIQAVVVAWQVYDLTRQPLALAYVGLAQFLPMLVLLLPAGDLIDRFSRKPILALSWGLSGLCGAGLWWLAGHGHAGVSGIYAVLVVFGCARAFSGPALQSLLPQVVPREQLAQAIAANSMLMRAANIGGPFVGGLLYAWGGAQLTFAVCCICFALGTALFVLGVRVRPVAVSLAATQGNIWQRFGAGIHFIRTRPIILGTISLDLFAVLLGGVVALLPIYAAEVLHAGPQGLGALRSAMAVGEVSAGLYLSMRPFDRRVGRTMFIAVAIFGLANLVFSLSTTFWLSFAALMVAGAADMVSVYIRGALVQFSTPDDMRGRVNAVNMLFIGSSNELGEFRAGSAAAALGVVPAAVTGALCTLGVVSAWAVLFKPLRRVNRFEEATPSLTR
ncbi:MFS family permease [Roseateles terrae]|uniref:MFS family permease n=1 Tax=Roseateles terrae TaxID=431060 RepID=A0ABR6GKU1_9BURK|nr:MFS transporter [Roseateles terrae]MBB3192682.1 MFS family permease [Roseateles terrae]